MLKSLVSSNQVTAMETALATSSLRQKVISNNIANVNTPGFKQSDVRFESVLREVRDSGASLAVTHEKHLSGRARPAATPSAVPTSDTSMRHDGNNVDIDAEMAYLAENSIYYDAVAQQLNRHFSRLKTVINEGKR